MGWTKITLWKRVIGALLLGLIAGLGLRYGMGFVETAAIGPDGNLLLDADGNTVMNKVYHSKAWAIEWLKPFGNAFVDLIKMLVVPLIIVTLVSGVTAMGDKDRIGSLGVKTIGLYLLTTAFAVTIGLIIGTILQPGAGVDFSVASAADVTAVSGKVEDGNAALQASFL
ncbi:MAG: cation:dicarboxylase symporter family transporter, partial [Pseudomonadota bacterium]